MTNLGALLIALCLAVAGSRAATLQGSVLDSKGVAVKGALIQVASRTAGEAQTIRSDANGKYNLMSLRAGTYTVHAEVTEVGKAIVGPFTLEETETKSLNLVLTSSASPEFFDEPKFTVAGVTDNTYAGGHGSDTVLRSAEALAKATASLSTNAPSSGAAEEKRGNALSAVREYQRAAELDSSESNLFDWGIELLVHKTPKPAIEVFTKGIRLYPRSSRMLIGAAVAFYATGDYPAAARRFFESTDINPADPHPYLFLAKVQSPEVIGSDGFRERLARFATLQPENALANYYYATALWNLRTDPSETATLTRVRTLLKKAVRLDPTLANAYLQLGIVDSERHDFGGAIANYKKAVEFDARMEQAHYRLAQAYRQTGKTREAQRESEIFRQLSTTSALRLERERATLQQFVITLKDER